MKWRLRVRARIWHSKSKNSQGKTSQNGFCWGLIKVWEQKDLGKRHSSYYGSNGPCYFNFILFHEPAASSGKHKEVSTASGTGLFRGGSVVLGWTHWDGPNWSTANQERSDMQVCSEKMLISIYVHVSQGTILNRNQSAGFSTVPLAPLPLLCTHSSCLTKGPWGHTQFSSPAPGNELRAWLISPCSSGSQVPSIPILHGDRDLLPP